MIIKRKDGFPKVHRICISNTTFCFPSSFTYFEVADSDFLAIAGIGNFEIAYDVPDSVSVSVCVIPKSDLRDG